MSDPSKPVPLEGEAVEIAAKALIEQKFILADAYDAAQAAIHAFLDAMGVTVEEREQPRFTCPDCGAGRASSDRYCRLVSRWFPIKGPVDE